MDSNYSNMMIEREDLILKMKQFSKKYDQVLYTYIYDRKQNSMNYFTSHQDYDLWTLFSQSNNKI